MKRTFLVLSVFAVAFAALADSSAVVWNDDGSQTFEDNGHVYTVPLAIGQPEANTETAVYVTGSEYAPVKQRTYWFYDMTNVCYRNNKVIPSRFDISYYARSATETETVLSYTNAATGVFIDSNELNPGYWMMDAYTNNRYVASFYLKSVKVAPSFARMHGVTNVAVRASNSISACKHIPKSNADLNVKNSPQIDGEGVIESHEAKRADSLRDTRKINMIWKENQANTKGKEK